MNTFRTYFSFSIHKKNPFKYQILYSIYYHYCQLNDHKQILFILVIPYRYFTYSLFTTILTDFNITVCSESCDKINKRERA